MTMETNVPAELAMRVKALEADVERLIQRTMALETKIAEMHDALRAQR